MPVVINGSTGLTFPDATTQTTAGLSGASYGGVGCHFIGVSSTYLNSTTTYHIPIGTTVAGSTLRAAKTVSLNVSYGNNVAAYVVAPTWLHTITSDSLPQSGTWAYVSRSTRAFNQYGYGNVSACTSALFIRIA